jgi:predicted aspartyl protease
VRAVPLLALLLLADSSPDARPAPQDFTPFEWTAQRGIAVPVRVNGTGPFAFLLDTGSSHSVVAADLAKSLGAQAVSRTVVASPLGEDTRAVVRLERVELGPEMTAVVFPTVVAPEAIDKSGKIRGVIGQDVLASRRYTIDFRRQRVLWHRDPVGAPLVSALRLELAEGRFLVTLPQRHGVLRLVPDSGSPVVVLFQHGREPLTPIAVAGESVQLATLGGQARVTVGVLGELKVGPVSFCDVRVVLVPPGLTDASEGDGLLPLSLFESVTFDGPQRLLWVGHRWR